MSIRFHYIFYADDFKDTDFLRPNVWRASVKIDEEIMFQGIT